MKFNFWWNENYYFCLSDCDVDITGPQVQVITKDICRKCDYNFTYYKRGFCFNQYNINEEEHLKIRKTFSRSGLK